MRLIPQERIQQRTVEQIIVVPVLEVVKEMIEVDPLFLSFSLSLFLSFSLFFGSFSTPCRLFFGSFRVLLLLFAFCFCFFFVFLVLFLSFFFFSFFCLTMTTSLARYAQAMHDHNPRNARAGALVIHHPAWVGHHTGGSRSTPTVHRCRQGTESCGWLSTNH